MITRQVFIRTVSVYVVAYLVLLATILGLMYAYPKPELHMLVNSQHTSSAPPAVEEVQVSSLLCRV